MLGGQEIDFNDLLGRGQPLVLNFWAGLCPPCRQEMPDFQKVYNEQKDKFILVGVDVGPFVGLGSHDDAREFLREFNITYPAAFAKTNSLLRQYNVLGMPTTVFFTPDGKVFRKHTGFMTLGQMRSNLEDLLNASSKLQPAS
ncbi:MAG TPA: TlpA disulfide reductase family protein [Dehalococcoidia bacterium]|nr:TlpA disulfide reductase family protein [Dehalococcoidia bacterium]